MAALRQTIRVVPRAQFLRSSATLPTAAPARRCFASVAPRSADDSKPVVQAEQASEDLSSLSEDPAMNGNYPDPSETSALPLKRQFRDPYAKWWDPQERRNYGEPLHEDNDILGIFSPEDYRHFTPGRGLLLWGGFLGALGVVLALVSRSYPDKVSAPKTYEGGLEAELGGPGALRARKAEDDQAAAE